MRVTFKKYRKIYTWTQAEEVLTKYFIKGKIDVLTIKNLIILKWKKKKDIISKCQMFAIYVNQRLYILIYKTFKKSISKRLTLY